MFLLHGWHCQQMLFPLRHDFFLPFILLSCSQSLSSCTNKCIDMVFIISFDFVELLSHNSCNSGLYVKYQVMIKLFILDNVCSLSSYSKIRIQGWLNFKNNFHYGCNTQKGNVNCHPFFFVKTSNPLQIWKEKCIK